MPSNSSGNTNDNKQSFFLFIKSQHKVCYMKQRKTRTSNFYIFSIRSIEESWQMYLGMQSMYEAHIAVSILCYIIDSHYFCEPMFYFAYYYMEYSIFESYTVFFILSHISKNIFVDGQSLKWHFSWILIHNTLRRTDQHEMFNWGGQMKNN